MRFYVGLHQPSDAGRFGRCMVSVNRLRRRKSDFAVGEWMLDSGAFTQVTTHGRFLMSVIEYAEAIRRWAMCGKLVAAVSQDYMCESPALAATGLTVAEHQRLTIGRYWAIRWAVGGACYVMPVLQGYWPDEYVSHVDQYGAMLRHGQWVGVGSVCKRNVRVEEIEQVLMAIRAARPDLRLHGFGVKTTALDSSVVRECLDSADSMAWSYAARRRGGDSNDWREADAFRKAIASRPVRRRSFQWRLF